jgi:hypothetical protein
MMRLAAGLALLLAALPAGPALAQARAGAPATCERDLFQNEGGMRRELTRLQASGTADQATQCRIWREHVGFLQRARSVFATCQTGRQREQNVGQMDQSLAEYRVLLADRCKGR